MHKQSDIRYVLQKCKKQCSDLHNVTYFDILADKKRGLLRKS